jgi:hypothetical protein
LCASCTPGYSLKSDGACETCGGDDATSTQYFVVGVIFITIMMSRLDQVCSVMDIVLYSVFGRLRRSARPGGRVHCQNDAGYHTDYW